MAPDINIYRLSVAPRIEYREQIEKQMRKLARSLPAWENFGKDVKGFGELGMAVIVGECGDLANYDGPAKVWKRLGLSPYDGHAAKTWMIDKWRPRALTKDEWKSLGYSPQRRAEIFAVIGDPLFRAQTAALKRGGSGHYILDAQPGSAAPYRAAYDARRERTAETHPDWGKMHSHMDALRIMTKGLIRDLWCAWNDRPVVADGETWQARVAA